jgi:uracil-DNA glycosylase family 4
MYPSSDKYVPGGGPIGAKIMFIGESPSFAEIQQGKNFVGPAGKELDHLCKDAKIIRGNTWITNVVKYFVPPNPKGAKIPFTVRAKNAGINVERAIDELQEEVNAVKPNVIVGLGSTALWALTGKTKIGNYRGSIMRGMGRKCVNTYHPVNLVQSEHRSEFMGYWNRQVMLFDFKRALRQSEFPEIILPERHLQICRSSYDLAQFRERYKGKFKLAVDIEAGGSCIPICVGLSFDKRHGMVVPLWNEGGISSIPDADMVSIWILLAKILAECDVVGQNFNYDRDKIKRLGFIIKRLISDTMYKAFAINPELPKKLSFNTSIYTEEPFYKDEGMYEGDLHDLLIGCARDACVTLEVDEAMDKDIDELNIRNFYENFLMKLPDFYLEIENTGFSVNNSVRDQLLHKYIEWDERLRYELWSLTGEYVNCQSHKQVAELLFHKLSCPTRSTTGEEDLTSLLNLQSFTDERKRRVVELILEDRRVRKTISTYIMALPDYDGRMKTTCFPCLETGRSSNGQQEPPIRPYLELRDADNKKKKKCLGTAFQTMTKHGDVGADIRMQYEADKGWILVQGDSEQAEARVVANLANAPKQLELYEKHDIHALTASWFFGGSENQYSKKILGYECPERFIGKTLRHAGERGAKERRAAAEVNTQARKYKVAIKIVEAQAKEALRIFHDRYPELANNYFAGIVNVLKRTRYLHSTLPYGVENPVGPPRLFFERWGDELFREAYSYIPQRAVSDNTKAAGMRTKARWPEAKIILESHDSLLFMVREEQVEDFAPILKEEMERPINFSVCSLPRPELSIPCAIEIGYNYMDLKKMKIERAA